MPENRKSVVVDIISDSKRFLSGFEESIREIEKATKKANILGSMQDDIDELKSSLKSVSKIVSDIKVTTDDASLLKLQERIEKIDSSIKVLKDSTKNIKLEVDEASGKGVEKIIHQIKANVLGSIDEMKQATAFLSDVFNIKTSNSSLNEISQDISKLKSDLKELKKTQDILNKEDNSYSGKNLKDTAKRFDELKLKYEETAYAYKTLKKQIDSGQSVPDGKKQLGNYSIELAKISKELLSVQDRLYDFKSFDIDKLFDDSELKSAINKGEQLIVKRISKIESQIKDLGGRTVNAIDEEVTKLEVKDGKIKIPVELDQTVGKLKNTLKELLDSIQSSVDPITVPIQLVSAYKTNVKNEINELKEIQTLQKGIDQLNDESDKKIAQSTLDKIKAQFEKELRIDIKTNIKETQKEIESGLNKIKNILKRENISVYPKFELTEENKQKLQKKLYKISDSINIDFSKQFAEIQQELTTILDNNQVDSWAENFIHKLDEICNKFKTLTGNNNFINDFINGWSEADKIMSSKHQKESLNERGAYFNSKTGYVSNTFTTGNNNSYDLSQDIFNACLEEVDTFIHSHPEKYAALSTAVLDDNNSINGDILSSYYDYLRGIKKQLVRSMEEIEVFDAEKFYSDYSDIFKGINTDPKKFNELSKKLLDAKEEVLKKISNNIWFYLQEIIDEYGRISDTSSLSDALIDNITPNNALIVNAISDKFKGKDINSEFLKYLKTGNHLGNINEEFVKFIFSGFNEVDFDKLINSYSSVGVSQDDYLKIINEFKENIYSSFKKYFANTFNLPNIDWDDLGQINYRMATPEILENAFGIKDFDKYTKVYSNKEWNENNPLGLKNNTLSGIFDNTGIENLNKQFPDLLSNIKAIENAINSVSNILRKVFNISSELELDNQFENVRKKFYDIANIDGSFDARKKELKELISEYQIYLDMGGKKPISDLTENEKSQKKLIELFNKHSAQSIKEEKQAFTTLSLSAEEAAKAKEKFVEANKKVKDSADNSVSSIKNEKSVLDGINQTNISSPIKDTFDTDSKSSKKKKDVIDSSEAKQISDLSKKLQEIIKKIKEKNELFEKEAKIVATTIPDETEKIGKLVSALTNVKKILEDISISSKGLDLSNLSNLGQLNKLKADKINTISTSIRSLADGVNGLDIKDGNILNSLQDILNKANELKDLASILKSTTSQINAVKGNTKTQSAQNLLTGSENDIRDFGVGILENQDLSVLSTALKATSKGTVELIALVQDLKGNFQEYTLSTTNGVDFTTLKVEEGTNSVEKQALTWKKLHDIIAQQPNNISMDFIDETSQSWKEVSSAAENYKNELGEIVSITRSIRQDKDGNALESFKIMGSSGNSVTIGAELESVALKQRIDDGSYEKITKHNQDIIVAYKERNKQTKEYYKLLEKVKSGTATDTELEKLNNIIEQWDKAINKKDEYNIQSGGDTKIESDAKKIQDEFVNSQSLNYSSMADKYVQGAKTILNKLSQYNFTDDFQAKINKASEIINNIKLPLDLINDQESIKDVGLLKNLMSEINNGWKVDSNRISNETAFYKLQGKIADTLKENTAMSSKFKNEFRELLQDMEKWGPSIPNDELKKLTNRFFELNTEMKKAGKTGRSFFDMVTNKAIHMSSAFIGQYLSLYDFVRYAQQGFETIKEYDVALTEMNKVSDESIQTLKEFQSESFELANSIGTTAQQIQNSTADFMRLGESLEEAKQSAQDANILFNVSEFGSIDEATESLVSMSQAYKELEKGEIIDVVNNLGNNFAISTDGLATALQNSASALKTAQNDFFEAAALTTAANTVVQDPDKVGAGLRTIALRLTGTEAAREELQALGEDVDDFVVTTTSKMDQKIKDLTKTQGGFGVSLLDMNGNYRSTYEVLLDIAKVWDKIAEEDLVTGENRQNALLEMMAGKNRANILASVLQSPEVLEEAYAYALDSEGSALKENEAYLESIQGHLDQLKNSWDNLWINENNREVITFFLDLAKSVLDAANEFGALNTLLVGGGGIFAAIKSFQGEGRLKKSSLIFM